MVLNNIVRSELPLVVAAGSPDILIHLYIYAKCFLYYKDISEKQLMNIGPKSMVLKGADSPLSPLRRKNGIFKYPIYRILNSNSLFICH